jgi:3-methylcrotonyl-CoA carboxylase alpha subunit
MILLNNDEKHSLSILEQDDHYEIRIGDSCYDVRASLDDDRLQATVNGHRFSICGDLHQDQLVLFHEGETFHCALHREQFGLEDQASEGGLQAPMNGSMVAVLVKAGDRVKAGQTLVIMEAMKMEHAIKAPADGSVSEVFFAEGDLVSEGAELIALELDSEEAA